MTDNKDECIFIVIPAYNEEKHIRKVLLGVQKLYANVVVVDDGSSDNTSAIALNIGIKVLKHAINLGKGAAAKTGCDYAVLHGADTIVLMDADGQHDPLCISDLLEALNSSDLVIGARELSGEMPAIMKIGNLGLNFFTRMLFGVIINDTQSGFRAFRAVTYRKIRWKSSDYSMETEMLARAVKNKLKIAETRIPTVYHDSYKGTTPMDGLKIFINMLRWRIGG